MANEQDEFHPSAVGAVNEALVMLGEDAGLTTLTRTPDPKLPRASVCRKAATLYEGTRLRVLAEYPWRFLSRVERVASAPDGRGGWLTDLPAGAGQIQSCRAVDGSVPDHVVSGRTIHSDRPLAAVACTHDEDDLGAWPAHVRELLVRRLAAELAKPVTGRMADVQLMEQRYTDALDRAKWAEARQTNPSTRSRGRNHYADAMLGDGPLAADPTAEGGDAW